MATVIVIFLIAFCAGYCLLPINVAFFKITFYSNDWAYKFNNVPIFREYVEHEKWRFLYLNRIFFSPYKERFKGIKMAVRFLILVLNIFLAVVFVPLSIIFCGLFFSHYASLLQGQLWIQALSWCWTFYWLGQFLYALVESHYSKLEETSDHEVYKKWRFRRDCPELIDFP